VQSAAPVLPTETVVAPIVASDASTDRRNIKASYADGATFSVMVGFGETYFAAFALAVGLSQLTAGLLTSVPLVVGGLLQLAGPLGARWLGSYRKWVLACASVQALVHIPLAVAALRGQISAETLYALTALYWAAGMAAGPAWNNWIDAIIPKPKLRDFLAVRSRITQLASFIAFLLGGILLHLLAERGAAAIGFALLFGAALISRLVSVGFLARQTEAPVGDHLSYTVPLRRVLAKFREPGSGRFLFFLLASQVSVYVASPFFSPYILAHVGFNYAEYVALVSAAFVAKIVFYPAVAAFVRRVGPYRALWTSALVVAPPPLFWLWAPSLGAIIAVQIVAGTAWAAFELASTLMIYDNIAPRERVRILTVFNLFNAAAVLVGAVTGGLMLGDHPTDGGYQAIFITSAVCRLFSVTALFGAAKVKARARALAFRTIGMRPRGALSVPILTLHDEEQEIKGLPLPQATLADCREITVAVGQSEEDMVAGPKAS
jgi:MFS family permease